MTDTPWTQLEKHQPQSLIDLFKSDKDRVEKMTIQLSGLRFDLSKTHLDSIVLGQFEKLALVSILFNLLKVAVSRNSLAIVLLAKTNLLAKPFLVVR